VIVAMDAAIHAAIIGGIVSGAVVLTGVVLTAWLTPRTALLVELRRATTVYLSTMPLFMLRMAETPTNTIDLSPQEVNRRLIAALATMEQNARRLRLLRHRRAIRSEVKVTMAQVTSISLREVRGAAQLAPEERAALNATASRLNTLVLHGWQPSRDEVTWYVTNGVAQRYQGDDD
jgi:hypothetical protein